MDRSEQSDAPTQLSIAVKEEVVENVDTCASSTKKSNNAEVVIITLSSDSEEEKEVVITHTVDKTIPEASKDTINVTSPNHQITLKGRANKKRRRRMRLRASITTTTTSTIGPIGGVPSTLRAASDSASEAKLKTIQNDLQTPTSGDSEKIPPFILQLRSDHTVINDSKSTFNYVYFNKVRQGNTLCICEMDYSNIIEENQLNCIKKVLKDWRKWQEQKLNDSCLREIRIRASRSNDTTVIDLFKELLDHVLFGKRYSFASLYKSGASITRHLLYILSTASRPNFLTPLVFESQFRRSVVHHYYSYNYNRKNLEYWTLNILEQNLNKFLINYTIDFANICGIGLKYDEDTVRLLSLNNVLERYVYYEYDMNVQVPGKQTSLSELGKSQANEECLLNDLATFRSPRNLKNDCNISISWLTTKVYMHLVAQRVSIDGLMNDLFGEKAAKFICNSTRVKTILNNWVVWHQKELDPVKWSITVLNKNESMLNVYNEWINVILGSDAFTGLSYLYFDRGVSLRAHLLDISRSMYEGKRPPLAAYIGPLLNPWALGIGDRSTLWATSNSTQNFEICKIIQKNITKFLVNYAVDFWWTVSHSDVVHRKQQTMDELMSKYLYYEYDLPEGITPQDTPDIPTIVADTRQEQSNTPKESIDFDFRLRTLVDSEPITEVATSDVEKKTVSNERTPTSEEPTASAENMIDLNEPTTVSDAPAADDRNSVDSVERITTIEVPIIAMMKDSDELTTTSEASTADVRKAVVSNELTEVSEVTTAGPTADKVVAPDEATDTLELSTTDVEKIFNSDKTTAASDVPTVNVENVLDFDNRSIFSGAPIAKVEKKLDSDELTSTMFPISQKKNDVSTTIGCDQELESDGQTGKANVVAATVVGPMNPVNTESITSQGADLSLNEHVEIKKKKYRSRKLFTAATTDFNNRSVEVMIHQNKTSLPEPKGINVERYRNRRNMYPLPDLLTLEKSGVSYCELVRDLSGSELTKEIFGIPRRMISEVFVQVLNEVYDAWKSAQYLVQLKYKNKKLELVKDDPLSLAHTTLLAMLREIFLTASQGEHSLYSSDDCTSMAKFIIDILSKWKPRRRVIPMMIDYCSMDNIMRNQYFFNDGYLAKNNVDKEKLLGVVQQNLNFFLYYYTLDFWRIAIFRKNTQLGDFYISLPSRKESRIDLNPAGIGEPIPSEFMDLSDEDDQASVSLNQTREHNVCDVTSEMDDTIDPNNMKLVTPADEVARADSVSLPSLASTQNLASTTTHSRPEVAQFMKKLSEESFSSTQIHTLSSVACPVFIWTSLVSIMPTVDRAWAPELKDVEKISPMCFTQTIKSDRLSREEIAAEIIGKECYRVLSEHNLSFNVQALIETIIQANKSSISKQTSLLRQTKSPNERILFDDLKAAMMSMLMTFNWSIVTENSARLCDAILKKIDEWRTTNKEKLFVQPMDLSECAVVPVPFVEAICDLMPTEYPFLSQLKYGLYYNIMFFQLHFLVEWLRTWTTLVECTTGSYLVSASLYQKRRLPAIGPSPTKLSRWDTVGSETAAVKQEPVDEDDEIVIIKEVKGVRKPRVPVKLKVEKED